MPAFLGVLWYVLANLGAPFALLQVFLLLCVVVSLAVLPEGEHPRLRCAVAVVLPLCMLLSARLLAEYGPAAYQYPTGLTMIALSSVSLAIDRYRGDAPERGELVTVVGYVLFFPTIVLGPILRYKQYLYLSEHRAESLSGIARGACLYMLGFVKRIAVAAVMLRALEDLLAYGGHRHFTVLPVALLLSFALFYFFVSGYTDMARGLMQIYGFQPPRGQGLLLSCATPQRMLEQLLISFDRYLQDYVARPLSRLLGKRLGGVLGTLLCGVLTVLFWRTRGELLLIALPLLLLSLLLYRFGRWRAPLRHSLLRLLLSLLSGVLLSVLLLAMLHPQPLQFFSLVQSCTQNVQGGSFFYLYSALNDAPYVALYALLVMVLCPLRYFWPRWSRRLSARVRDTLQFVGSLCLLAVFVVTLVHFLPQFPQYSEAVSTKLLL